MSPLVAPRLATQLNSAPPSVGLTQSSVHWLAMPTSTSASRSASRTARGGLGRPPCAASQAAVRGLGGGGLVEAGSAAWRDLVLASGASRSLSSSRGWPSSALSTCAQSSGPSMPGGFCTRSQSTPSIGKQTPTTLAPFRWCPEGRASMEGRSRKATFSPRTFHSPSFLMPSAPAASPTLRSNSPRPSPGTPVASTSAQALSPSVMLRGGRDFSTGGMVWAESFVQGWPPILKGVPKTCQPFLMVPRIVPFVEGSARSVTKVCTTSYTPSPSVSICSSEAISSEAVPTSAAFPTSSSAKTFISYMLKPNCVARVLPNMRT
mmetsp:Transcript_55509/g.162187  ORF Transcript_55509/g.162187 Transcript_55509/m.162187 type:complete len:320 (-) Transcript_55509:928-1887(-)